MKLVELLAREMNKWPEDCTCGYCMQACESTEVFFGGPARSIFLSELADDRETAKVTTAQWQAERDRQKGSGSHRFKRGDSVKVIASGETEWCRVGDIHKIRVCKTCPDGELVYVVNDDHESCWIRECNLELVARSSDKSGEWKRHRGGKCPVPAGTKVSTRHRNGEVVDVHFHTATTGSGPATMNTIWKHTGDDHDIMAYKIISQPQAEEVEVNTFVGKDVKIEYAYAQEGVEPEHLEWKTMGTAKIDNIFDLGPMEAKTDQIDGPTKWRDEVTELNAYIEKYTRERDALIERLASEGFALIPPVVGVVSEFSGVQQIIPFEEWTDGDIVRCIDTGLSYADLTLGNEYTVVTRHGETGVTDDEGDHMYSCIDAGELEFVRRP